jgi:hypothetical protein
MEKLEGYASQVSNAAQALTSYYRLLHTQASLFTKARTEIQQSRQLILSNLNQIQILLNEPGAFIQQLATQVGFFFYLSFFFNPHIFQILTHSTESISRLYSLARRVPGLSLHPLVPQCPLRRCG